jgi:quinol monooxygenase YgiN
MLIVTARLSAAAGQEGALETVLTALAAQVRENEPGCLLYTLCRGKAPGEYVVVERYQDDAALGAHGSSEHFKAALPKIGACLAVPPQIEVYREVG